VRGTLPELLGKPLTPIKDYLHSSSRLRQTARAEAAAAATSALFPGRSEADRKPPKPSTFGLTTMVAVLPTRDANPASSPPASNVKQTLAGMTRARLSDAVRLAGVPDKQVRMRVNQLWKWIYISGVATFDAMTDVSKDLRAKLADLYTLERPEVVAEQVSIDGTRKWLLRLPKRGHEARAPEIECVYIPEEDRGTLCISSQVGCTLTCTFCHTGTQKLVRNLEVEEIVGQILLAKDRIGDWPGAEPPADGAMLPTSERKITNIVLMGMGEPLYNFDNVRDAMDVASDGEGLSMSKRRITLSTSGVVPEIGRWGEEAGTMLAISLHAVRDELRDKLVPINKKYPLADLLEACRNYPGVSNPRRITFEYVMLKGVNDSLAEARELVRLLAGIPAKINLIPFNPWPGTEYECSDWAQIEKFADVVNKAGYASPVRTPRGRDILAACGQLKSESQRLRARERSDADAADRGA
jgi:23S rRNA (adenine2503-C2)-methyltransferase